MSMSGPDGHRNSPDGHSKDKVQLQNVVPGQMVVDGWDGGKLTRMILVDDGSLLTRTSKMNAGFRSFLICQLSLYRQLYTISYNFRLKQYNHATTFSSYFILQFKQSTHYLYSLRQKLSSNRKPSRETEILIINMPYNYSRACLNMGKFIHISSLNF